MRGHSRSPHSQGDPRFLTHEGGMGIWQTEQRRWSCPQAELGSRSFAPHSVRSAWCLFPAEY